MSLAAAAANKLLMANCPVPAPPNYMQALTMLLLLAAATAVTAAARV